LAKQQTAQSHSSSYRETIRALTVKHKTKWFTSRYLVKSLPFGHANCSIIASISQELHEEMTDATAGTLTSYESLKLRLMN
jgi:hypothetical protein